MHRLIAFAGRVRESLGRAATLVATRLRNSFYVYLATVFSLFIVVDAVALHVTANMRQTAFDTMVRYRIVVPRPDPDIVIVDIDEASLAAMAKDYGRWPWPRQVLGEFLEHLEAQRPRAVVFDILFSDPDVYNPDSDDYFDAAVARTTNTFFPLLRLGEASDPLSRIRPEMIPGATPVPGEAQADAHVAVVLPHFPAILQGGRLGFHNIYPDPDGIVREYLVYRTDYGWTIPSLPARVVGSLGYGNPVEQRVVLNWRGKPFSYRTVSFADLFDDMASKERRRAPDEFTNKIVLIGSTAPSLFDVKPTPLSRLHPGVEILATAIDNLKRGDYLRYPAGRMLYPPLALLIVWATAWAFYRDAGRDKIDRLFGAWQVVLVGVSYASINFTKTYVDLTGPVTVGLAYFTAARVYAAATSRALETSVLRASLEQKAELEGVLLLIDVGGGDGAPGERALGQMRRRLQKVGTVPKSVETLKGHQEGLWALLENVLVVSWAIPAGDRAARRRVAEDITAVTGAVRATLPRSDGTEHGGVTWVVHEGPISGGEAAKAGWRALFAEAQLRWLQAAASQEGGRRS
jgi:CHASE2 domain-containing sensor protein